MDLISFAAKQVRRVVRSRPILKMRNPDYSDETLDVIGKVLPFAMSSPERIVALREAVRYVEASDIPGAFVECGVWKGGSSMAAALSFKKPRPFYLYDTYEGMTPPSDKDKRSYDGKSADDLMKTGSDRIRAFSPLDEVRKNMASTGYPDDLITYVKGPVEKTIPNIMPNQIAILRLDTDWYESTRHELEYLYPHLSAGGVLIVDDYGWWEGAKRAVDEYFGGKALLHRIDVTGRLVIKQG